jgi:hypothetical protein
MNLTKRSGRGGGLGERCEAGTPIGTEFTRHPAANKIPAHGRRVRLELCEFLGVFYWKRIRNGRKKLSNLHQRALQATQYGPKVFGMRSAIGSDAEHPLPRHARRNPSDGARRASHPAEFAEKITS